MTFILLTIQASPITIGNHEVVIEMKRTTRRGKWDDLFTLVQGLVSLAIQRNIKW